MYERAQFAFPRLTSLVKKLVIGLLCCYVGQLVFAGWLQLPVVEMLAMQPGSPMIWQLVTYVLVDLSHPIMFVIGLLFIWWALAPFEAGYGPRRTLQLCLTSILAASLPAYLLGMALPSSPPLFGAHVLWFGGFSAFMWLNRGRSMSFFGIFTSTGERFLWIIAGLSLLIFIADKNHTQLVADLGAMAGGIGFVNWMRRPRSAPRVKRRRAGGFKVIDGGKVGGDDDRPKWLN